MKKKWKHPELRENEEFLRNHSIAKLLELRVIKFRIGEKCYDDHGNYLGNILPSHYAPIFVQKDIYRRLQLQKQQKKKKPP